MEEFITIKENIEVEFIEKKSKFITNIIYVENLKCVQKYIKEINEKYRDATHNCFAYRVINENTLSEKVSDDGEPTGTAGVPILNILQKNKLINILVVVTRYFGGIMLGAGGLVRAYSEGAKKAVEESCKIKKVIGEEIEIILNYKEFEKLKYSCQLLGINIIEVRYLENIACKIEVEDIKKQRLMEELEVKNINIIEFKENIIKYIEISI